MGYDEGKYGVLYKDGQLTTLEITNDASRSNTEGNEASGGVTLGKAPPSVSIEGKVTESATKGSGNSIRATLDQTKRAEMLAAADKLVDERQRLIVSMDNRVRFVMFPKGSRNIRIGRIDYHIDENAEWARKMGRARGTLGALGTNFNEDSK